MPTGPRTMLLFGKQALAVGMPEGESEHQTGNEEPHQTPEEGWNVSDVFHNSSVRPTTGW